MFPDDPARELVELLRGPAALCAETGELVAVNEAFTRWAPAHAEAHLVRDATGIWLVAPGALRLPVRTDALASGHLLVQPVTDTGRIAVQAVVNTLGRRLERVAISLEANLGSALRERPEAPVSDALRESLALVEELRGMRRQVRGLAPEPEVGAPEAVRLGSVVEEALGALTGPLAVDYIVETEGVVVAAVRERLFWAVVTLAGTMSTGLVEGHRLIVTVQGTAESGRLLLRVSPSLPTSGAEVDAARRAVAEAGGRLLVDTSGTMILQFPAYGDEPPRARVRGEVLVVDDDPSALAMMASVVRRSGFSAVEADNGVAASAFLRTRSRSLVALVTDAVLPGRSGLELVLEARRRTPALPVLLVTGHDEDLIGATAAPVLRKPFGARLFRERLEALVSGHE